MYYFIDFSHKKAIDLAALGKCKYILIQKLEKNKDTKGKEFIIDFCTKSGKILCLLKNGG